MKHSIVCILLFIGIAAAAQIQYAATNKLRLPGGPSGIIVNLFPDSSSFILQVANPQKKKLNVWIHNSVTGILTDTTVYTEIYRCRYQLANVDDGRYTITVADGRKIWRKELEMLTTTTVTRNLVVR